MEEQCSPLSWGYCYQEEGSEELRYSFLYTLELETTIVSAKEEISRREFELICLKDVLSRTIKERDEAQTKCQKLMLEKLFLQQQLQKQQEQPQQQQQQQQQQLQQHQQEVAMLSGISSSEDESKSGDPEKQFTSSTDCNKDIVVSSFTNQKLQQSSPQPQPPALPQAALNLAADRPLPEKGKLLKAVMEAGPLLQNLLLAGALPQWQHPPPQLDSIEIPPVAISSSSPRLSHQASFNSINCCLTKKRGLDQLYEESDSSPNNSKYQKLPIFH